VLDVSWSDESNGLFLPKVAAYMENEKQQIYEPSEIQVSSTIIITIH